MDFPKKLFMVFLKPVVEKRTKTPLKQNSQKQTKKVSIYLGYVIAKVSPPLYFRAGGCGVFCFVPSAV
jgi:hypothetical protein